MKKKTAVQSAFLTRSILVGFASVIVLLLSIAFTLHSGGNAFAAPKQQQSQPEVSTVAQESSTALGEQGSEASTPALGDYPDQSVGLSGNATITPSAAPANITSITVSTNTNFKGTFAASPTTGVIRVTDAHPVGIYNVNVTGFGPGGTTTKTFVVTVSSIPCGAVNGFDNGGSVSLGSGIRSVAIGDFNGDGKQDFAVANWAIGAGTTVSIRLGNGSGGFSSAANVTVGTAPISIAIGDFNGDGKQDLAVANDGSSTVSIRLGNGSGGFTGSTNISVGSHPLSVAIGDFNGDGKQDFATANHDSNNVSIRLGDGLGGFSGTTNVSVGTSPFSVVIGDFNGDGKQDLAVANAGSSTVSIRLGDGLGGFSGSTEVSVGSATYSIAIGDFNGDGKQDLAAPDDNSDRVFIRFGDGLGGFSGSTNVSTGSGPYGIAIGDFNGDGNQDLAVATFFAGAVSIRFGDGLGGFSGTMEVGAVGGSETLAIGDFNGDGKQDLVAVGSGGAIRLGVCFVPTPTPTTSPSPTPTPTCTPTGPKPPTPTPSPPTATPAPQPPPSLQCWNVHYSENFDGVVAPQLPQGWTTSFTPGPADCSNTGTCTAGSNWRTDTNAPYTSPNIAFHDAPMCVTDATLDSPPIIVPQSPFPGGYVYLYFFHNFDFEEGYDGGVLEISINGGPFTDIFELAVQADPDGSQGFYNGTIACGFSNPLATRSAWTGSSHGYIPTRIRMPFQTEGQTVIFRFRLGTDCSNGGTGWRIDNLYIITPIFECGGGTPTPTPIPVVSISGGISYCSNPTPVPVSNVVLSLTGSSSGSTLSNGSGNYSFSSLTPGGSYTVTPGKSALSPATSGINNVDVIAVQRQFLGIGVLSGCRLSAADVNGDTSVNNLDVIAVQRFYLGSTNGTANVGKHQFNPSSRTYPNLTGNQPNQNYDALIFGDVSTPFIYHNPAPPVLEAENAVLTGCYAQSDVQASNGFRVDGIDAVGDSVKFTQVPVGTRVTFWYATPNNGQMSLYVNDVFRAQVDFAPTPGGWIYPFVGKEVVTDIPAGSSVKLQFNSGDAAINLDYIQIY